MITYKVDSNYHTIVFSDRPPVETLQMLKYQKFRWDGARWWRRRGSWEFLDTLEKQIDKANGVRRPDGTCWTCKDTAGFFRARGAATPVLCDSCAAKQP